MLQRLIRAIRVGLGLMAVAALVSGCGFRLQGTTPLPFDTLLVTIPENTEFGADVRRAIRAASPQTTIVNDPSIPHQAKLQEVQESRTAREVSLNPQGRVEEFELTLRYTFRLVTANDEIILPATTLTAVRDLPFDDRVVQAKEIEEATLFRQMQKSLVPRLLRRISAVDVSQNYAKIQKSANNGR
jgi:LPS-assembly lipoprotein